MLFPFPSDGVDGSPSSLVEIPGPSLPTASFSAIASDMLLELADTSVADEAIASWLYDWGDGSFSTIQNPAHVYVLAGSYLVTQTITTASGLRAISSQVIDMPSTTDIQAAILAFLSPARRGIAGTVRVGRGQVNLTAQLLWESQEGPRFEGAGIWQTDFHWDSAGGAPNDVPALLIDQCTNGIWRDFTFTVDAPLVGTVSCLEVIRFQDDETDPADPGLIYKNNNRSSQNTLGDIRVSALGRAPDAFVIYLATFGGGKNDHHFWQRLTADGYTRAGCRLEGQASTSHWFEKLVLRGEVNGGSGLFGIVFGILPGDAREGTEDPVGDTWTSIARKGGTTRMVGGEVMQHGVCDYWLDSANGCIAMFGVTHEGSARLAKIRAPGSAVSVAEVSWSRCKWTSNTDLAADGEILVDEGTGHTTIEGGQYGLVSAPVELCLYKAHSAQRGGFKVTGADFETPYRHGMFTGMYPQDVRGSSIYPGTGTRVDLLDPHDGPGKPGLAGRILPYTAEQWRAINEPVPSQWYACQESLAKITITSVDAGANTLTTTLPHGHQTGEGPFRIRASTTVPGNTSSATDYYLIRGSGKNTLALATSAANALAGSAIDISSAGSGTIWLERADRRTIYSLDRRAPRHLTMIANTEPDDLPVLRQRRTYPGFAITSFSSATDIFTRVAHGYATGLGPLYLTSGGTTPTWTPTGGSAGRTAGPFWFIRIDNDTWKLAESLSNAMAGTAINFADTGSGTLSIGGDWHRCGIQFAGAVGQILSFNDPDHYIDATLEDYCLDLVLDITGKTNSNAYLAMLGGGGTDGLNMRTMNTGKLKMWAASTACESAVDYTTIGPTLLRIKVLKSLGEAYWLTPYEDSRSIVAAATLFGAGTFQHTQHEGIGVNSASAHAWEGYLYDFAVWRGPEAALVSDDLTRRGF